MARLPTMLDMITLAEQQEHNCHLTSDMTKLIRSIQPAGVDISVGGEIGEFPENTFLFETSCAEDPVLRVTGVNRCLEGLACDAFRGLIDYARETGDEVMAQAVDFVLADELTHVRFGSFLLSSSLAAIMT